MKSLITPIIRHVGYRTIFSAKNPGKGHFADPSYDMAFKMLFGQEKHKSILVSLLDNLLGLKAAKVANVEIVQSTLVPEYQGNLEAEVDVRCKLSNSREILVEMQRVNKEYFLPRTQYYMAKALSMQMLEGQEDMHHKVMLPTYVLVIAGNSIFTPKNCDSTSFDVRKDMHFEKTVVPYFEETGKPFPAHINKMHWKFYELNKFSYLKEQGQIDLALPKHQWLEFMEHCTQYETIPTNMIPEVRQAFAIMEKHNWTKEQIEKYDLAVLASNKDQVDAYSLFEDEINQARDKAQAQGEAKQRIKQLLDLLEFTQDSSKLAEKTGFREEQINKLLQDKDHIPTNASNMLGYEYNLLEIQDQEAGLLGEHS